MTMYSLKNSMRRYWELACGWDGINPNSGVAVFSAKNPYSKPYSCLVAAYLRIEAEKAREGRYER
jgi:hypothetical protein